MVKMTKNTKKKKNKKQKANELRNRNFSVDSEQQHQTENCWIFGQIFSVFNREEGTSSVSQIKWRRIVPWDAAADSIRFLFSFLFTRRVCESERDRERRTLQTKYFSEKAKKKMHKFIGRKSPQTTQSSSNRLQGKWNEEKRSSTLDSLANETHVHKEFELKIKFYREVFGILGKESRITIKENHNLGSTLKPMERMWVAMMWCGLSSCNSSMGSWRECDAVHNWRWNERCQFPVEAFKIIIFDVIGVVSMYGALIIHIFLLLFISLLVYFSRGTGA